MKVLNREKAISIFFESLKKIPNRALLLDYDGTLAPFRIKRDEAFPYPGVTPILEKIIETGKTRLVVISGRGVNDLIPLLSMAPLPEIWGSHGGERLLLNGEYVQATTPENLKAELQKAENWLRGKGWGGQLEKKPLSLALHWRGMPESKISRMAECVRTELPPLIDGEILNLHEFDGGLELRYPTITKAEAVNRILKELPAENMSAYLGDDLTDEDAFAAIKARGLAVLVRDEFRKTCADLWLRPPSELLEFLKRWLSAIS